MQFSLASLRLTHDKAMDKSDGRVKERFDPLVCQCCGFAKKKASDPDCLCEGLVWHMLPGGDVECEGHRFARMVHGKRRGIFDFGRK